MTVYKPKKEEKKVLDIIIAAGNEFKPLHKKLGEIFTLEMRQNIAALKQNVFECTQGSAGRVVMIDHDPQPLELDWNGFCLWAFDVTARRINQLLDTEEARDARAEDWHRKNRERITNLSTFESKFKIGDVVEGQKFGRGKWIKGIICRVPDSIRGMYWVTQQENPDLTLTSVKVGGLGEVKKYEPMTQFKESEMRFFIPVTREIMTDAKDQMETTFTNLQTAMDAAGIKDFKDTRVIAESLEKIGSVVTDEEVNEVIHNIDAAGVNPRFDTKDPYAYFEQFKSELQTMGDEISSMLIEFGLDLYQIKDVLRYAEKDAKATLSKSQVVAA
jgi:hypothetical protein